MEIKIYAVLSLLPFIYVIRKVVKRQDLTCFDLILTFHTLYFAVVPLVSDVDDIEYKIVRNNSEVHFLTFFSYNMFAYMLCIADSILKRRKGFYLYNLTALIRYAVNKIIQKQNIVWLIFAIEIFLWFMQSVSTILLFERGVRSLEDEREAVRAINTPIIMLLMSLSHLMKIFCLFLFSSVILTIERVKKSGERLFIYVLVISFVLLLLQGSRSIFIHYLIFIGVMYYSLTNNRIKFSVALKGCVMLIFIYLLVFPMASTYRKARKIRVMSGNISLIESIKGSIEEIRRGSVNTAESDNKDTRIWNVYQIYALSMANPKNYNGVLTANAISIGIPRVILPSKSITGSQLILEEGLGVFTDTADSVLLMTNMENHYWGNFYALFIFWSLVAITNWLMMFFYRMSRNIYFIPIYIGAMYQHCCNVESTPDGFLSGFLQLVLLSFFLWGVFYVCNKMFSKNSTSIVRS